MDKKQQIVEAAIELFATQGYEKTSIASICELANVSKGAVFHHFKNKDELLRGVFIRMTDIMNEVSGNVNPLNKELSPKERLVSFLEEIFSSMVDENQKLYYQFDFQVLCNPTVRTVLKDLIEQRYRLAVESFQSILCDIPTANSLVDCHMLIAEIDGIALNYLFAKDDYPMDKIKQRFIKKYLLLLGF